VDGVALTRSARVSGDVGKVLLTVLFLLVFFESAIARQQSANNSKNSDPPSGQISGRVYSAATGQPLAKAVVSLENPAGDPVAGHEDIQTGSDGSFQFAGVAPGKYQISVSRCGYLSHSGSETNLNDSDPVVALGPGEKREGLSFHLVRGGVISGTVTDEENEPVPGLQVEAMAYPYEPGGNNRATSGIGSLVYTDDLGNFRISDLNSGGYFVMVGDDEQKPTGGKLEYRTAYYPDAYSVREAQRVRVTEGTETSGIHVTIKLQRAFSIRGHAHGSCQGGDEVSCSLSATSGGTLATEPVRNQSTDEDGEFVIAGLFSGEYSLTASATRRASGEPERFLGIGNVRIQVLNRDAEAEVSAGPLAEVSGVVEGGAAASKDQPFTQVSLLQISEPLIQSTRSRVFPATAPERGSTASKSRFQITSVEPGTYVFQIAAVRVFIVDGPPVQINDDAVSDMELMYLKEARCGGHDYAKEPLELGAGARLDNCTVKIGRDTASINGRVMDGDKGVAGQIVVAIPESSELRRNPRYTLTGRTNHDGQFTIAGIIPGDYLIFAVTPNAEHSYFALDFAERNASTAERATFKPGETKTFVLRPSAAQ
jgi:protocatechuate 3,4-dioxygenase beta subunit